jgi:hypothetical protein
MMPGEPIHQPFESQLVIAPSRRSSPFYRPQRTVKPASLATPEGFGA